jgi:hypothetical protein
MGLVLPRNARGTSCFSAATYGLSRLMSSATSCQVLAEPIGAPFRYTVLRFVGSRRPFSRRALFGSERT